jgi:beta-glucanase (GH16 family)
MILTIMNRLMLRFALLVISLPALAATNGKLVWSDEFNGHKGALPDASKWTFDLGGGGWGNQELEVYTRHPENIFQDGQGHLVIRAIKTDSGRFTSARIKTEGKFAVKYGKIEARIKIPSGQGMWPAFWMLGDDIAAVGWPKCGEIDVMENIGKEPAIVHGTVHGPGYSVKEGISSQYSLPSGQALSNDFHVYSAEWSRESITFFLDGKAYATVTPASLPKGTKWVFDHSFFLLLNLAVGGSWPGSPDKTTTFPRTMILDWVRVWQVAE